MNIKTRQVGDVTILDVKGKVTIGSGDIALRDEIQKQVSEGNLKILVNLEGVSYMDSAGLGEMIRSYTTVTRNQGMLKLLNLTKKTRDILTITKLITVFDVFEDEQEALESFA